MSKDAGEEELIEYVAFRRKAKKKTGRKADMEFLIGETIHIDRDTKTCPECGSRLRKLAPLIKHVIHYTGRKWIGFESISSACISKRIDQLYDRGMINESLPYSKSLPESIKSQGKTS